MNRPSPFKTAPKDRPVVLCMDEQENGVTIRWQDMCQWDGRKWVLTDGSQLRSHFVPTGWYELPASQLQKLNEK